MTDDLERRIRDSVVALGSADLDASAWERVRATTGDLPGNSRRTGTWRPVRIAVVAIVAAIVISGLALGAEPTLRRWVFPPGSDADRMQAMQDPPTGVDVPLTPQDMETIRILGAGSPARIEGHRVLMHHRSGPIETTLHAFPTESGDVCYIWVGSFGAGSCGRAFVDDEPVTFTPSYFGVEGEWTTVTNINGLATDEVTAVDVELEDGTIDPAIMGRNSFLWYPRPYVRVGPAEPGIPGTKEKPDRSEPHALVVHLEDGTERRYAVPPA